MKQATLKMHNAKLCFSDQTVLPIFRSRSNSLKSPTMHFAKFFAKKSENQKHFQTNEYNEDGHKNTDGKLPTLNPEPCLYFSPWVTCSFFKSNSCSRSPISNVPTMPSVAGGTRYSDYYSKWLYQTMQTDNDPSNRKKYIGFFPSPINKSPSKNVSPHNIKAVPNLIVRSTHLGGKRLEVIENQSIIKASNIRGNKNSTKHLLE
jgi:hypothetical protein